MQTFSRQEIIGIVGGMGPMAGVLLQKLIIESTVAKRDQDHIPVVTFTNPNIPDRTTSLFGPLKGSDFTRTIQETAEILVSSGATVIGIPCNTSHARFAEIQARVSVPIVNMVKATCETVRIKSVNKIGLLATNGTIATQIYQRENLDLDWIRPSEINQQIIMQTIYGIKSGIPMTTKKILPVIEELKCEGAEAIVLACTELSLLFPLIIAAFPDLPVVDSSRALARSLVQYVKEKARQ